MFDNPQYHSRRCDKMGDLLTDWASDSGIQILPAYTRMWETAAVADLIYEEFGHFLHGLTCHIMDPGSNKYI